MARGELLLPDYLVSGSYGSLPTDRQFPGQQNQPKSRLYHMGARWYDPTLGLWTQPDTLVPNPLDPLSLNRYAFVEGNPLNYVDPLGHASELPSEMLHPGLLVNIASPLNVNQTEVITQPPLEPSRPTTTIGPALGPCCFDKPPDFSTGPVIQTNPDGLAPTIFAATDGDEPVVEGNVEYGPLDDLKRPTGVHARLVAPLIAGQPIKRKLKPPGFGGEDAGHDRGHLLGKQLGGSGSDPRNFVTMYEKANSPEMRGFENEVAFIVSTGQTGDYSVTPIYDGDNLIPTGTTLEATGSAGFYLFVSIRNIDLSAGGGGQ